jgi:hypothetical protein
VAAELNKEPEVEARLVKGHLGELSVNIDGQEAVRTNPLWYPRPARVIEKAKEKLKG